MMEFAPLLEPASMEEVLASLPPGRVRLVGRARGYLGLVDPTRCVPEEYDGQVDVLVAQDVLPRNEERALEMVVSLVGQIVPGGTILLIEQSQQIGPDGKGLLQKGLEAMGMLQPPERLTRLMLMAGLTEITQVWPQGVRALVVTSGQKPAYWDRLGIRRRLRTDRG